MRQGTRLAVDVGRVRIGVAQSDIQGLLATPLVTLHRRESNWIEQFRALVSEVSPIECIVGLPVSLSGKHTASTNDAIDIAQQIHSFCEIECRLVDERFSTASALGSMKQQGISEKKSRSFIDQVAAVNILQHALDIERSTGKPAGILLGEYTT